MVWEAYHQGVPIIGLLGVPGITLKEVVDFSLGVSEVSGSVVLFFWGVTGMSIVLSNWVITPIYT